MYHPIGPPENIALSIQLRLYTPNRNEQPSPGSSDTFRASLTLKKDLSRMQDPLTTYSETHHKLARALAPLAGNQQSYSRQELLRLARRKYPELNKGDIKPQKHCLNPGSPSNCPCSQSPNALFEKIESSDGSTRFRVLSGASHSPAPTPAKSETARLQTDASAFARAPVAPAPRRPEVVSQSVTEKETPTVTQPVSQAEPVKPVTVQAPQAGTPESGGLLPKLKQLKQWLTGDKPVAKQRSRRQSTTVRPAAARPQAPKAQLPPLPPLPALPVIEDYIPEIIPTPVTPAPVFQVLRLPAPGGVQRLMLQPLTLADDKKLHLKLSPLESEVSLELVHLHFRDQVVKELAVVGSEPLEIGFRLIGPHPASCRIQIDGLIEHEWIPLHTSEQSFPVLPEPAHEPVPEPVIEPVIKIKTETASEILIETISEPEPVSEPDLAAVLVQESEALEPMLVEPLNEPVIETPEVEPMAVIATDISEPAVPIAEPAPELDPLAWQSEVPEHYLPLLLHLQTHGSLSEAAMITLLGGGNAGARKARGFAVQVDQWLLPFEIEVEASDEGKTYRKV